MRVPKAWECMQEHHKAKPPKPLLQVSGCQAASAIYILYISCPLSILDPATEKRLPKELHVRS